MPPLRVEPARSRQRRRFVQTALRRLHAGADRAVASTKRHAEAEAALRNLEDTGRSDIGAEPATSGIVLAALIVVTLLFDTVFLSPSVRYAARSGFPGEPVLVDVLTAAAPYGLLILDLVAASMVVHALEGIDEGGAIAFAAAVAAGIATTCIAPLCVLATSLAERDDVVAPWRERGLDVHLAALLLIATVPHGLVVFSGRQGQVAKERSVFWVRRLWLRSVVRGRDRARLRAVAEVREVFLRYASARNVQASEYPDWPIEAGPFFANVREVLREFDAGNSTEPKPPPPAATPAPPPPDAPAPVAAPPAIEPTMPTTAMPDIGRDIRDADSELTP